jgi:YVTN family beta-propeller protein
MIKQILATGILLSVFGAAQSQCPAIMNQPSSQAVCSGATITKHFTGTGATGFTWTNSNTAINLAATGVGDLSFTALNTNTNGVTESATITVIPQGNGGAPTYYAYIPNFQSNTVRVINTSNGTLLTTITTGFGPTVITTGITPVGSRVYVCNTQSGTTSVIDPNTNTVMATLTGTGAALASVLNPAGSFLYILTGTNVRVYNTATNALEAIWGTGATNPRSIAVSADNSRIYVPNSNPNQLIVMSATDGSPVGTISLPAAPTAIVADATGQHAYISSNAAAAVFDVNTNTNTFGSIIVHAGPRGLNLRPDGQYIYVACSGTNEVAAISTSTNAVVTYISTGNIPTNVDFSGDGLYAYVTNQVGNSVTGINAQAHTVTNTLAMTGPHSVGHFTARGNGPCNGPSKTFMIVVRPPQTAFPQYNNVYCDGTAVPVATVGFTPALFTWTNSNPAIGLPASGTGNVPAFTATVVGSTAQTSSIRIVEQGNICSHAVAYQLTINPRPQMSAISNQVVCAGTNTAAVSLQGTIPGTYFQWFNNNPGVGLGVTGGNLVPAFLATNNTTTIKTAVISVLPILANCAGTQQSFAIIVPPAVSVFRYGTEFCQLGRVLPFISGTHGGNFSAQPAGLSMDATNGELNLALSNPGNYTVNYDLGAVPGGCISSGTTQLTINPSPVPDLTGVTKVFCKGTSVPAFTFTGTPNASFYWFSSNPLVGIAATSGLIALPAFTAYAPGPNGTAVSMIRVAGVSDKGCHSKAYAYYLTVNGCGVPGIAGTGDNSSGPGTGRMATGLTFTPNPAIDNIRINMPFSCGTVEIRVMDQRGNILRMKKLSASTSLNMGLSGLLPGIYLVQAMHQESGRMLQGTVVKQ